MGKKIYKIKAKELSNGFAPLDIKPFRNFTRD
jgi:hypothetical protein